MSKADSFTTPILATDPIYAAIYAHRVATAVLVSICNQHDDLEEQLPAEKCRAYLWDEVYETDDPRWIKNQCDLRRACEAEVDTAARLVTVRPTTRAGILALLRYAVEQGSKREGWPELQDSDGEERSWHVSLMESLAEALPSAA